MESKANQIHLGSRFGLNVLLVGIDVHVYADHFFLFVERVNPVVLRYNVGFRNAEGLVAFQELLMHPENDGRSHYGPIQLQTLAQDKLQWKEAKSLLVPIPTGPSAVSPKKDESLLPARETLVLERFPHSIRLPDRRNRACGAISIPGCASDRCNTWT